MIKNGILQIKLTITLLPPVQTSGESPLPNKSRFTVVVTPGLEKVAEDSRQLRVREGPTLSKGVVALGQLTAALANQPYADRVINYRYRKFPNIGRDLY